MLGLVLMYVAIVLMNNGFCRLMKTDGKSTAVMNVFAGMLSVIANIVVIIHGDFENNITDLYAAATGLLFGFTYLFVAVNNIWNLDWRPYGWYSLFVAINSIPAAYLSYSSSSEFGDEGFWFAIIWLLWGILWLTGWIETVLKKELKWVPYLAIFEGIVTAWIPAWLIITGYWY